MNKPDPRLGEPKPEFSFYERLPVFCGFKHEPKRSYAVYAWPSACFCRGSGCWGELAISHSMN